MISWPSCARQVDLTKLVEYRVPLLTYTFGLNGGKNLEAHQPSNADLQNMMYNGWLHTVFVMGAICFTANGCIIWSKHNSPGSWNDSDTFLASRGKLLHSVLCLDTAMNVVSDSAFPCSTDMTGRILTSLGGGGLGRLYQSPEVRQERFTTRSLQCATPGMGSIQKVYGRVNPSIPDDAELSTSIQ
ncbi:hypothetical protein PI124_g22777 [Phytophthora idaei]|nr:hypothetical protein PI125_g20941 [Phytophthora idaei]KAG3232135.1 hypothetical protein PI124_g22777 [Phytophthora idaei]